MNPMRVEALHTAETTLQTFSIGLFDVGNSNDCIFAYCCPQWAAANARSFLDGSPCCFNFFCISLCMNRWLIRSAYGIDDSTNCTEDFFYSTFCSCCVANQLLQSTKAIGNPSTNGGINLNSSIFNNDYLRGDTVLQRCLCSFCCTQCMIGKVLSDAMGMPFWLGCLCVGPCAARNVLRYHYRIMPTLQDDNTDEMLIPLGAYCGNNLLRAACPIVGDICFRGAVTVAVMQMATEVSHRGQHLHRNYLVGYDPTVVCTSPSGIVSIAPAVIIATAPEASSFNSGYSPLQLGDTKD